MDSEHLVLGDGTECLCNYFAHMPDLRQLWIFLNDVDLADALAIVCDRSKTKMFTYLGKTVEGYTRVDLVETYEDGIKIRLSYEG